VIINRHNYEEFFLLYIDDELSLEDRTAVDQFLEQNADLKKELEMLQQTTLPADEIKFEAKEILYKQAEGISLNNYEEYFLLSVDKELDEQQNEEVQKFVLKHPGLQNEFMLLAKTQLEPQKILFPGKEKLLRKEKEEKPVVFLLWTRVSAAAAIIGLITATWFFTNKNSNGNAPAVSQALIENKINNPVKEVAIVQKPDSVIMDKSVPVVQKHVTVKPEKMLAKKTVTIKTVEQNNDDDFLVETSRERKAEKLIDEPGSILKVAEDPKRKREFEEAIASAKIEKNTEASTIKVGPKQSSVAINSNQNAPIASHAVYKELDTRETDEENTFYIGSAEINKNKLKGLFKKAASLFERKNDQHDEERTLKIAVFEIKSK